jgi:hypothetical protein
MADVNPTPDPKAVTGLPALKDLRLFTVYWNGHTDLCSLRHRCVIAGWDGGGAQDGIPHVVLTGALARQAGVSLDAPPDDLFWETFFDHLETHPEILGG